jgi:hypothetical protein
VRSCCGHRGRGYVRAMRAVLPVFVAMVVGCTATVRAVDDGDASVSLPRADGGDSSAPVSEDASDGAVAIADAADSSVVDAAVPVGWCSAMPPTQGPANLDLVTSGTTYDCRPECGGSAQAKALKNTFSDGSVRATIPPGRAPGCKYIPSAPNVWCCPTTTCVGSNGGGRCGSQKYYSCEAGGVMAVTTNCRQLTQGSDLEWCCDDTKPY